MNSESEKERRDVAAEGTSEPAAGDAAAETVDGVAEEMVDYADEREADLPDSGPDAAPAATDDGSGQEAEESELERALRERAEYLDLAQRSRAELENYRRRMSGEAAGAEQRGRAGLAREMIPAIDNLERALLAAGIDPEGGPGEGDEPVSEEVSAQTALAEGVALVYRELGAGLKRAGVEAFDPFGERFDPSRHEAVATSEADGVERGQVLETLEKGYSLGDQVLRPARVVVSG